jgi:stearoyl-CoA desaturase (Delta-9 desaturase)
MSPAAVAVQVMPAQQFAPAQRRHFVLSVVLPSVLAVLVPLLWPQWVLPAGQGALAAGLGLGMWFLVGGVGVSVGLHRHFSHRSFEASPALRWCLGACGSMAAQGPVVYWVALHRMHHAASDRVGDPHSPQLRAWAEGSSSRSRGWARWQGHIGWVWRHDVPKPTRYARELIADAQVRRLSRAYPACVAAGIVLPAALACAFAGRQLGMAQAALLGAYWGGVLRIALGHHVIWAINSWCHMARDLHADDASDASLNVAPLALVSWGESWHRNHHAQPASARFGQSWRQPDIGWWLVCAFERLGWARGVRRGDQAARSVPT